MAESLGGFCLMGTYRTSLMVDIGIPEQFITIITAIMQIMASIGSKKQIQFHNRFRNKSLSIMLWTMTCCILIAGIMGIIHISYGINLTIIIIVCFAINYFVQGMNGVLTARYLGNFANEKILTQIFAVNSISENIFRAGIGFLGSYLLRITNTANSIVLIGIILLITVIGLTSYMKTRLGLKPEEYDEKEIFEHIKEEI